MTEKQNFQKKRNLQCVRCSAKKRAKGAEMLAPNLLQYLARANIVCHSQER
jgi:hypothetical protein